MFAIVQMMGNEIMFASDQEVKDEAENFKAICFIIRADETKFKKYLDDLKSSAYLGKEEYPKTLAATYNLLVREYGVYNTNNNSGKRFQ